MNSDTARQEGLFSVRMHASSHKGHLCGAERIVSGGLVETVARLMVGRAVSRGGAALRSLTVRVDAVDAGRIRKIPLLPIRTVRTPDPVAAREEAADLLARAGVSQVSARRALDAVRSGASPTGGNMRGGMIVDARSGERLERDPDRGVRVSRMDLAEGIREEVRDLLSRQGILHPRVMEAVILASKAAAVPGVAAEVCRSDDPDYTTGYVASPRLGYVRILNMKAAGDPLGGRAYFVDRALSVERLVTELEEAPYLIEEIRDV